jgi:serine phosphatase RsbU (regulator of sigma subunit)
VAANGVGGDLYDWVVRPDKTIAFIVADVSGHDLAAALIASACHAYFRTCALNAASLEDLVLAMDRNLRADLTCGRFVTAVLGFIDPGLGETRLFSAGHGLVFLRAHATAGLRRLEPGAPPFGVCEFEPACAAIESLLHGETLYVVTDGWYESVPGRARGMDAALRAVTRSHDEEDDGPATARGGPPEPAFPIARVPRREDDRTIVTLRRIQGSEGVAAVAGRTD